MSRCRAGVVVVCLLAAGAAGRAEIVGGRVLPPARDAGLSVGVGAIVDMAGEVRETTRPLYTATGREYLQERREDYDLEDFGMDGGYATFALAGENAGKYVTLGFRLTYLGLDTETTALRDYYIGVSSVSFAGRDYEYMQIPEGTPFTADFTGGMLELHGLVTPLTFQGGGLLLTPWLGLGLLVVGGQYKIDAGPATGTVQYLNPPETYVVGGEADGFVVGGLPELNLGGELRLGASDALNLVVRLNYGFCSFEADAGMFSSADHHDKDLTLDHANLRAMCGIEWPLEGGRAVSLGVTYQSIKTEAETRSSATSTEEIIANRERFDKDIDFDMTLVTGVLGYRF
jgi:hypothetical protein